MRRPPTRSTGGTSRCSSTSRRCERERRSRSRCASSAATSCRCSPTWRSDAASPESYQLPHSVVQQATSVARHGARLRLFNEAIDAAAGVDAVYTDTWTSMGQEAEADVRRRVFAPFQVNEDVMAAAGPGALFMHCLPAHRGEEVTSDVFESDVSVVFDQAENRLHGQKALLLMLLATTVA